MVMHARKTQRISDGYFEKHQAHPYQNSKYGSSKGGYGSTGERYERIRDSPNGNSFRSESPDSQSPRDRDRSYPTKSYLQKIREKERENRDYKMSRDKYSDCARSPKDKRSRESRDSEHRTNHDRSGDDKVLHPIKMTSQNSRDRKPVHNCQEKREERERLTRVGDWSEHISSSGKKYYYNCKTEVSQWEKPREWIERERDKFRSKERDKEYSRSSHDKHSSSRVGNSSSIKDSVRDRENKSSSRHWSSSSSRDDSEVLHDPRRKHSDVDTQFTQDMDISPGDSTPTSEVLYNHSSTLLRDQSSSMLTMPDIHAPTVSTAGPVLLATALPRLVSNPTTPTRVQMSPQISNPQSTPSMVPAPTSVITCNAPGPPVTLSSLPRMLSQIGGTSKQIEQADVGLQKLQQNMQANSMMLTRQTSDVSAAAQPLQPLKIDTNHAGGEGPPTPTHSENQDCPDMRKQTSPPSSLSSLQGVASSLSALRPQGPSITPSLANYYRDDLVNHVRGWPADILEKQAQKLSDEAHIMGSLQCTKVSAELKCARSLVRITEIQATLHEQRILFLRQQIKTLEELKSQNSFMSDDS